MAISTAIKATRILKNLGKGSDQTAAAVEAAAALRAKQYIFAENSFEPAFKSFNALENGFDDKTAALIIKRLQVRLIYMRRKPKICFKGLVFQHHLVFQIFWLTKEKLQTKV